MKITDNTSLRGLQFSSLPEGTVFKYGEAYYLKVKDGHMPYVVNLTTWGLAAFPSTTIVHPAESELILT